MAEGDAPPADTPNVGELQKQIAEMRASLEGKNREMDLANQAVQQLMVQHEETKKALEEARKAPEPVTLDPLTGQPIVKKKGKTAKLKKKMEEMTEVFKKEMETARNQLDQLGYESRFGKLPEELRKKADATLATWKSRKILIDGREPTRQDALMFAAGHSHLETLMHPKEEGSAEEQEPIVEIPAKQIKARVSEVNPDNLSRQERLEKLWPARLDGPGGF